MATSLCEGEAIEKRIGLLQVYDKALKMEEIRLKTVRPFVFDEKCVTEFDLSDIKKDISEQVSFVSCTN